MRYKYASFLILVLIISGCKDIPPQAEKVNSNISNNNSQELINEETPKVITSEELIDEEKIINDAIADADSNLANLASTFLALKISKSEKIINDAIADADSIKTEAQNKSNSLISEAQNKSNSIISEAEKKAEKLTSRAKYRKEFFEQYSILLLSIFSLLVIAYLAYLLRDFYTWRKKVNDKTVELPEVFRSDWKELVDQLSLLSTKEEILATDQELMSELERYKNNLSDFARKINTNAKHHKEEYTEGLVQLTKELELRKKENAELKEGYAINEKKKIFEDLFNLKERIKHQLTTKDDKFLQELNEKIDKIFSRIGIEEIHFDEGTSLEDGNINPDEFETVDTIEAVGDAKEYTVHKTEKIGYLIKGLNQHKDVIRKAKIIVVKAKEVPKIENDLNKKDSHSNDTSKNQSKKDKTNALEVSDNEDVQDNDDSHANDTSKGRSEDDETKDKETEK